MLLPFTLLALDPTKGVFQFNCTTWTHPNGLSANGINSITQTRDGFLWLGTQKGLVRFDGVEFRAFQIPTGPQFRNPVVSALADSRNGGLWFGLRGSGSFGFYKDAAGFSSPQNDAWRSQVLNIRAIHESDDGAVWIGYDKGMIRWAGNDTNQTHGYSDLGCGSSIFEGVAGRVWLGTVERGLYYWHAGQLTAFPDQTLAKDSVSALAEDHLGRLWVGTRMGLRCYDATGRSQYVPPLPAEVKALLIDRHDRLWIGTTGLGLLTFEKGAFSYFAKADGLPDDNVTALYEDHEGSLWVGTRNGLCQLSEVKLVICSSKDGVPGGGSHDVCASGNGGVWVTATLGICRLSAGEVRTYGAEIGFTTRYMKLVYEARDGEIYLVDGDKNILVLSGGKVVMRFASTNWPTAFAEDGQGVMVSIGDQLFRINRNQLELHEYHRQAGNAPFYWIYGMAMARDGAILIASANGVFRLSQNVGEHWTVRDGLPDNNVFWVREDHDGVFWAGLTAGIARIHGREVRSISTTEGLYDNFIYAMVPDDHGSFWFNSAKGVFRASARSVNEVAEGRRRMIDCTAFDDLESVKSVDTTDIECSGCKTPDGRIWFPNPGGVLMINPTNLPGNSLPPPVRIEQIRANGQECTNREGLTVNPGRGDLEFQYTAASFIVPRNVHFRYRLEGYDEAWKEAGPRRSASYTNLKPGPYRFQVQACNAEGIWNPNADSVELQLLPWFYQTAWFRGGCAAQGILLLACLYGWRTRHLRRQQRKLQEANELLESKVRARTRELLDVSRQAGMFEVATDVLHNVGNVLNSVNVSGELLLNMVKGLGTDKFEKAIGLLMEHGSDLASFLNGDEKGRKLAPYLAMLAGSFSATKARLLAEIDSLNQNIHRINEVVAMQQNIPTTSGVVEAVALNELVEDTLRVHEEKYQQDRVQVIREFSAVPQIRTDRHKVARVLSSLLANANDACVAKPGGERKIWVRLSVSGEARAKIEVSDTGVGIASEDLVRIFSSGFTTKQHGHSFGLHRGALLMKSLGGALTATSPGLGQGATFTVELPLENVSTLGRRPVPPTGISRS